MKKITALLIALSLIHFPAVFAEETAAPEASALSAAALPVPGPTVLPVPEDGSQPALETVNVFLQMDRPAMYFKPQTLTFDLRDPATDALLATKTFEISHSGAQYAALSFEVPRYDVGQSFIFHMSSGEGLIAFNGAEGAYFLVQTYSVPTADGLAAECHNDFYMELKPALRRVSVTLDGQSRPDAALYAFPEGFMIPAAELASLGIERRTLDDGGLVLLRGGVSLLMYRDQLCAYKNYTDAFNMSLAPTEADGGLIVPLAETAEYFGCRLSFTDNGESLGVSVGGATVGQSADEAKISAAGVSSDTNYLIWVSKSEFTVRVYRGSKGSWRRINSFACAIGAPSTPTIEGTFKYYQYQDRWAYNAYYVGPIMRFYNGFAIHSTLLRYNGSDYDGRTGVRISHGCVRVRPENIRWLVDTVPLGTTVYVTA